MDNPPPPPPGNLPPPPPPPGNLPPPPPPPGGYAPSAYAAPLAPPPPAFAAQPMYQANVRYAGFWIRFAAAFLDGLLVGVVIRLLFLIISLLTIASALGTGAQSLDTSSPTVVVLTYLIYLVFYAGYFIYFWGMGQTPVMRRFGLYVADANTGGPIGFGKAGIRFLGYLLSILPCYVGLIWAAFDPRKQGWHDHLAGSLVIRP